MDGNVSVVICEETNADCIDHPPYYVFIAHCCLEGSVCPIQTAPLENSCLQYGNIFAIPWATNPSHFICKPASRSDDPYTRVYSVRYIEFHC